MACPGLGSAMGDAMRFSRGAAEASSWLRPVDKL